MEEKLIKRNPCIGVCSTTYGDDICKGCKRFRHEVSSWTNTQMWRKISLIEDWKNLKL